jgi:hypothetical protein
MLNYINKEEGNREPFILRQNTQVYENSLGVLSFIAFGWILPTFLTLNFQILYLINYLIIKLLNRNCCF